MIRILCKVGEALGGVTHINKVWRTTNPQNFLAASKEAREHKRGLVAANESALDVHVLVDVDGNKLNLDILPHDLSVARQYLTIFSYWAEDEKVA